MERMILTSFFVQPDTLAEFQDTVRREKTTMAAVIRKAITGYLGAKRRAQVAVCQC
jgi:hypothetical protein